MNEIPDMRNLERELDKIYKRRDECMNDMTSIRNEQTQIRIDIATLGTSQKFNNWLTAAIAGGIIALVIKVFLGGG